MVFKGITLTANPYRNIFNERNDELRLTASPNKNISMKEMVVMLSS